MKTIKKSFILSIFILSSFSLQSSSLDKYWNDLIQNSTVKQSEQAYCFEDGGKVFGQNIDMRIKPASVTKLYTTLWSLDVLGFDHRFQTKFKIINNYLYIVGGADPYFVTENLLFAMSVLSAEGFNTFKNVYFSHDFYMNWTNKEITIHTFLEKILNTKKWDDQILETYKAAKDYLRNTHAIHQLDISNFSANKISRSNINPFDEDFSFIVKSSPLWMHLKQVNMYSNNFYTDQIYTFLGGATEFSDYIYKKLSATEDEIFFYTGSGLGDNYTTCRTTLEMLKALDEILEANNTHYSKVIAVPGLDNGTLANRFTNPKYAGKLAAKTGTLNDTSSLAGYIFTSTSTKFAIFNHTAAFEDKKQIREIQNKFIKHSIDLMQDSNTLNYTEPVYNSLTDIILIQ
jgi:D-alanyl-D-alanine carboxypeptidase